MSGGPAVVAATAPCPPLGGLGAEVLLWGSFALVAALALWGVGRRRGARAVAPLVIAAAAHPALWLSGPDRCGDRPLLSAGLLTLISVGAALSWALRPARPPADGPAPG
ncbi:MAG: hypothetical protein RL071_3721 [Pseudomonadota bacterium]